MRLSQYKGLPILYFQVKSSLVHVGEVTEINYEIGASIVVWLLESEAQKSASNKCLNCLKYIVGTSSALKVCLDDVTN